MDESNGNGDCTYKWSEVQTDVPSLLNNTRMAITAHPAFGSLLVRVESSADPYPCYFLPKSTVMKAYQSVCRTLAV